MQLSNLISQTIVGDPLVLTIDCAYIFYQKSTNHEVMWADESLSKPESETGLTNRWFVRYCFGNLHT